MLNIQHLTIIKQNNYRLIEDFSFTLGDGDRVALIGEEGNGKSTLLKAIYQPDEIIEYTSISGTIDMDYQHIGYLPQRLSSDWEQSTCMEYLLKPAPHAEIPYEAYNELAYILRIGAMMGICDDLILSSQPLCTLSGGEKVKLQLLKLKLQECDLYLLDEPTNDLDLATLEWLERFLLSLHVPLLFVSHDETLLAHCANRILHLEQRNKKSKAVISDVRSDYETYMRQRNNSRQRELQCARKEKQEYEKKKARLNDIMNAVHDAQNQVSRQAPHTAQMLKRKMHSVKAMHHRLEQSGYHKPDTLEDTIDLHFGQIKGIRDKVILKGIFTVKFAQRVLIEPFELDVRGRDKLAVIGRNGCGKTQLMKQFYDTLRRRSDICVGYMPQHYYDEFAPDQIAYTFLLEKADQEDITACRELLGRMKFTPEEMLQPMYALSEGQKAKLYIARFIKMRCDVLLLDEPTRNLSPLSAPAVRQLLKEFDGCIIAVTHDRKLLREVFTYICEVRDRRLIQTQETES